MLEHIKAFQRADRDKLRIFEVMVCALILLVVVGVMLAYITEIINRSREVALIGTARTLYMAVLDYTASGRGSASPDQKENDLAAPITEQSEFLRKYVGGSIKGKLTVTLDDNGYVRGIRYTEGNKTVTMPGEEITSNK